MKTLRLAAVFLLTSVTAPFAFAQGTSSGCTGTNCLQNPLRFSNFIDFLGGVWQAALSVIVLAITVAIVYAGFMFIMARGNTGKLTTARQNFQYVIIGAALILGAWVIATLIGATVTQVLRG